MCGPIEGVGLGGNIPWRLVCGVDEVVDEIEGICKTHKSGLCGLQSRDLGRKREG